MPGVSSLGSEAVLSVEKEVDITHNLSLNGLHISSVSISMQPKTQNPVAPSYYA
jgi:hypothetical protein